MQIDSTNIVIINLIITCKLILQKLPSWTWINHYSLRAIFSMVSLPQSLQTVLRNIKFQFTTHSMTSLCHNTIPIYISPSPKLHYYDRTACPRSTDHPLSHNTSPLCPSPHVWQTSAPPFFFTSTQVTLSPSLFNHVHLPNPSFILLKTCFVVVFFHPN